MTENDSADDRIAGLYRGTADCISMPCDLTEFTARVRANLPGRTLSSAASGVLQCADVMLNRNTREVFKGDRFVQLTAKEFDLLEYLMENYFQVVTRSQILENVWGYDYAGSSNIVEVYVRYLRKKLNVDGNCKLIHTVRSVGYILREPHATTKGQPIKVVA